MLRQQGEVAKVVDGRNKVSDGVVAAHDIDPRADIAGGVVDSKQTAGIAGIGGKAEADRIARQHIIENDPIVADEVREIAPEG